MAEAWLGQVYNSAATVSIGGIVKTPTAGYRYLAGVDSDEGSAAVGDVTGALGHLRALIVSALGGSPTVTLNYATGIVTIAFGTTSTLVWGSSELKAICGFTIDIPSSTGASGSRPAKGFWAPPIARDASYYPLDKELVWDSESTTRIVRASDGSSFAVVGSNSSAVADISYRLVARDYVVRDSTTDYGPLETFYHDVVMQGLPLRYLPTTAFADGDGDGGYGAAEYVQGFWNLTEDASRFTDFVRRSVEGYDGLWDIDIPLVKYDE